MEKIIRKNSLEITGNISSIGEIKKKSNGREYMYVNIAQNYKDREEASFYPLYLDGKMLGEFYDKELKIGNRIAVIGKLESYSNNGKTTMQIRPFEIEKVVYEKKEEVTKSNSQENSYEVGI